MYAVTAGAAVNAMHLIISWRNVWRNPRRTAVILTAVVIGVWAMIFVSSFMRGAMTSMVENGVNTLTGHLQVHAPGYRDDPSIEHSMADPAPVAAAFREVLPEGAHWSLRVRVNGVASNARHSTGVTIVGVDPAAEARVSFIGDAVKEGAYLEEGDPYSILVGGKLAETFETALGRKLVLMSQSTTGEIASRAFRIGGVYEAEMEATEEVYVFVDRRAAQEMLAMDGAVSEACALLPDRNAAGETVAALNERLDGDRYQATGWLELLPMLRTYLEIFDTYLYLWYLMVFIAMGFGIVNTTLMAVLERIREFGLLKSLGMLPRTILVGVLTETLFLLVLGMALGTALGWSTVQLLSGGIDLSAMSQGSEFVGISRVIVPRVYGQDVVVANAVVLVLGLLVSAYPALKAARITPVEALAHT